MESRTFESVISALNNMVAQKQVIDPSQWLEAAQIINLFLEQEQNKLFLLEQKVATTKCLMMTQGDTVAKARTRVEASQDYLETRQQKAKIERAIELIRISKLQARLTSDNMRSN
jgi:aspartate carbamoyltransferase catalytic subunit